MSWDSGYADPTAVRQVEVSSAGRVPGWDVAQPDRPGLAGRHHAVQGERFRVAITFVTGGNRPDVQPEQAEESVRSLRSPSVRVGRRSRRAANRCQVHSASGAAAVVHAYGWVLARGEHIVARRPAHDHRTTDCDRLHKLDSHDRFWVTALGYQIEPPPEGFTTWNAYYLSIGVSEDELDPRTAVRTIFAAAVDHYAVAMQDPEGNEFDVN